MKIKLYQKGGVKPYITNNPKDSRIQARQDSINAEVLELADQYNFKYPIQDVIYRPIKSQKSKPVPIFNVATPAPALKPEVKVLPVQQYKTEPYVVEQWVPNANFVNMDGTIETPNSGHYVKKTFVRRVPITNTDQIAAKKQGGILKKITLYNYYE